MDTNIVRGSHPKVPDTTDQDHPHACYGGFVFIGSLVEDPDTGEELEAFDSIPCRRCAGEAS